MKALRQSCILGVSWALAIGFFLVRAGGCEKAPAANKSAPAVKMAR
jgi:hypothetical protein